MKIRYSSQLAPYLWMLFGSASFACMGAFAHGLGKTCPWQLIAFMRSFIALLVVLGIAYRQRIQLVLFRPPVLWMRSIAGSLSLIGAFYALTRMPISSVLTLTNTFPVWVAVLSWPMLGKIPTPRVWLAVILGAVGVGFIQQPSLDGDNTAFVIAIAASLCTAFAMLGLHRLKQVDSIAVVVHFSAVSLLFIFAASICFDWTGNAIDSLSAENWLQLFAVGLTAAIGQIFLTWAFSAGDPAKVSVVSLSQVLFGLLLDLTLFSEHELTWITLLGIAFVVIPTAWVMLERKAPPATGEDL